MSVNGLESLALIRRYLAADVAAIVPHHVAAELKAAIKLIDTAMIELAALPSLLPAEIAAMRALCREGRALLANGDDETDARVAIEGHHQARSLPELIADHREAGQQLGALVARLQDAQSATRQEADSRRLTQLLDRIYQALGRQAQDRLAWQSVFPVEVASGADGNGPPSNGIQECST